MKNFVFFDDHVADQLLPLTFTRPVAHIRIGILTIAQKWEKRLNTSFSYFTKTHLAAKFPLQLQQDNCFINGSVIPTDTLITQIQALNVGDALVKEGKLLAVSLNKELATNFIASTTSNFNEKEYADQIEVVNQTWEIFSKNEVAIESDFKLLTKGRTSEPISASNRFVQPDRIFIEEGATIEFAILNPNGGYIYIGRDAHIMEQAVVRGSMALCEHGVLKMGAKIYGATTIGPYSKVGGEVSNSVIFGYSAKGHEGYLGNAVLGEWCNIGADSNNSNLKNNYAEVRLWSYSEERFAKTGLQFCGLIMGDHSKCGINTMFNTGTVVGVSANIYGPGFPRNFIASFAWGGAQGFTEYKINRANEVAEKVMLRRSKTKTEIETEQKLLESVYELTKKWRKYE